MRTLPALTLAMALLPWPAVGQAPLGSEFLINEQTAGFQDVPSVALTPGGFVVVWNGAGSDGYSDAKGRRFAGNGVPLGAEFRVNAYTTLSQRVMGYQSVAAGPDGRFVVAWTASMGDGGPGTFARRFDASGEALGGDIRVSAARGGRASVAVANDGNFVVAWEHDPSPSGDGIRARKFDAAGNPLTGELLVNTITTSFQRWPSIAVHPDGGFVVVWTSLHDVWADVQGQRFDTSANRLGGEFRVNAMTPGPQHSPAVAADADGSFVVAWNGEGPGDDWYGVFARRFDPSGSARGVEFRVNRTTYDFQFPPTVTFSAGGDFFVAWASTDGDDRGVFGQLMDPDGRFLAPEFQVNTHTMSRQLHPAARADASGRLVVVWDSFFVDGSANGIVAQRFGGLRPTALAVDAGGNGVAEPGEAVTAAPTWLNTSGAAAAVSGAVPAFTGPAPGVYAILDGSADYGTIANGSSSSCVDTGNCFVLTASAAPRPAAHWDARFSETLSTGHGWSWTLHVGDSFSDVPRASAFYPFVETLLHHGVTGGCGGGAYCPQSDTTREQMAVFVLVAKEGAPYLPPPCAAPVFADVPASNPFCAWIEELARRQVVGGCGGGNYCPGAPVTREQMAVFVLRTLDPALNPPDCVPPNLFNDVPEGSVFCRWIEELARRQVVSGCGGGNYCPLDPVLREQMGVFLSVTFGLALYGP